MARLVDDSFRFAQITPDQKTIIGGFKSMSGTDSEVGIVEAPAAAPGGNAVAIESLTVQHEGVALHGAFDHWLI